MTLAETSENGTGLAGVAKVLEYYGLDFKMSLPISIEELKLFIDEGYPILIALQAYKEGDLPYAECWDDGHYVVAIGYDEENIYFEDPSSYKRTKLSFIELLERWHDMEFNGTKLIQWGCVVKGTPQYHPNDIHHMDFR
jgi:uncharacterized protein YvpB